LFEGFDEFDDLAVVGLFLYYAGEFLSALLFLGEGEVVGLQLGGEAGYSGFQERERVVRF